MTEIRSVAVVGPGGVGGLIAGVLARNGVPVTCVAKESTVAAIGGKGLTVESGLYGRWTVHPEWVTDFSGDPAILFVTVKATGLEEALERVDPAPLRDAVVIPLLNGLEHMETIRRRFGSRVAAGSIRIVSMVREPGHVLHTSPFAIINVASDGEIPPGRLEKVAGFLGDHGVETHVGKSEAAVLWEKLVRLAALACTTSLRGEPIGVIRSDPEQRRVLENLVREGVAVAVAEGVPMTVEDQMAVLGSLPSDLTSSTQRDIEAGRPSELDAIAGSVVRAGEARGIDCPAMRAVIAEIERNSREAGREQQEKGKGTPICRQQ